MVNDCMGPVQAGVPFENDGVTVIVAVMGLAVAFVALNAVIFPVPAAANPMAGFEFVQL